jgi:hypothetical protein
MKILKAVSKVSLTLTFLFAAHAAAAFRGGMESGGGKGVLCGTHLRVLDLYEIEAVHGGVVSKKYKDLDSNLAVYGTDLAVYRNDSYIDPLDSTVRQSVLTFIKNEIFPKFSDIPVGNQLPLTSDATLPQLPMGCQVLQIAIYANDGMIYRDRHLWDMLDIQNQAALILHEGIYHEAKKQGAQTSDQTRLIVGLAFTEKLPEPMLKPIWSAAAPRVWCGTDKTSPTQFEFFAINESRSGQQGIGIYFINFQGALPMERFSAFVPQMSTYDFFKSLRPPVKTIANGSIFGGAESFEFHIQYRNGPWQNNYGIDIPLVQNGTLTTRAFCEIR